MSRLILATMVALSISATQSLAAKKVKYLEVPSAAEYVSTTEDTSEILKDEYYNSLIKTKKSAKRAISQESTTQKGVIDLPAIDATFSADFVELRKKLIGVENIDNKQVQASTGVRTPEELDAIITHYSKPEVYNNLSPQAKMVAIQLRSLTPYKSFFYRAQKYLGSGTALRSAVVTMLRNSSTGIQTFFPVNGTSTTNHWNVIFQYITEPMSGMQAPINTDNDLQKFVYGLIVNTRPLITDMEAIYRKVDSVYWDNRLYMSFANFTSEKDRYVKLGKPEMESILAGATAGFSGLLATGAYSFIGLSDATRVTSAFFGMEQLSNQFNFVPKNKDNVMGLKSSERFQILRQYPQLFVRVPGGERLMEESYTNLLKSVRYSRVSWESMKALDGRDRQDFLFDPRAVVPFNRIIGSNFEVLEDVLSGKEAKSTTIQGEVVKMNLKAFYMDSPKSMTVFYPVAFRAGTEKSKKSINGQLIEYRNYQVGSPVAWSATEYKKYFPDMKTAACPTNTVVSVQECTTEVAPYARILSQTWGAAGFGAVLAGMVF